MNLAPGRLAQAHPRQPMGNLRRPHTAGPRQHGQSFFGGEERMIAGHFDHRADAAQAGGIARPGPHHRQLAAGRPHQIQTGAEKSGLARAIGAQDAIDTALRNGQRKTVQRRDSAEPLAQIMRFDQG